MKRTMLSLAVAGFLVSTSALGQVTTTGTTKNSTQAYIGLTWELGGPVMPALVLGALNTDVKSNGDTTGVNLAFHVNLSGSVTPGKVKLSALDGKEDLQGELGVGYNFLTSKPLMFLGLHAPYVAVGVDGYLNPGLVPYVTIHSLGKLDKPDPIQTTSSTTPPVPPVD